MANGCQIQNQRSYPWGHKGHWPLMTSVDLGKVSGAPEPSDVPEPSGGPEPAGATEPSGVGARLKVDSH